MASITINIPDQVLNRVINGFCERHGYMPLLENGEPNPQTKAQFAKSKIIEYVKRSVIEAEANTARNEAETSVRADVETNIQLS